MGLGVRRVRLGGAGRRLEHLLVKESLLLGGGGEAGAEAVGPGQPGPGARELGVALHRLPKQPDRLILALSGLALFLLDPEQVEVVGGEIGERLAPDDVARGAVDRTVAADPAGDYVGYLALHREQVLDRTIPALGPDMRARVGLDQLRRDPHPAGLTLDRALEHVGDAEV